MPEFPLRQDVLSTLPQFIIIATFVARIDQGVDCGVSFNVDVQ